MEIIQYDGYPYYLERYSFQEDGIYMYVRPVYLFEGTYYFYPTEGCDAYGLIGIERNVITLAVQRWIDVKKIENLSFAPEDDIMDMMDLQQLSLMEEIKQR